MNTKTKYNWWIDLSLFAGFITTYFLNFTGVEIHQWIGILIGTLAAYHLFLHFDWVEAVTKRFFVNTSGQARKYYALDMLLFLGFVLIGATGLVISTWLNLPLSNFATWLSFHIIISITTLVILLLKLSLHWRWIAHTTRKIWAVSFLTPPKNAVLNPYKAGTSRVGRREFLKVIGVTGAASFLALVNATNSLTETGGTTEISAKTESTDTQTTSSRSSSSLSDNSCTVSCRKACSFPGHCHRYVDSNNNGRCDFGECV